MAHPQLAEDNVPVPVDSDSESTPVLGIPPVELRVRLPLIRDVAYWVAGAYVLFGVFLAFTAVAATIGTLALTRKLIPGYRTFEERLDPPALAQPKCDPNHDANCPE